MALIKSQTQPTGVVGEYWSISKVIDNKTNTIVSLSLWINETAKKTNGSLPLKEIELALPAMDLTALEADGMNHIAYCYSKIKESQPSVSTHKEPDTITTNELGEEVVVEGETTEVTTEGNWFADAVDA